MNWRGSPSFVRDPVWMRVLSLAVTLFFVFLADAILSFWVPVFLNEIYNNTARMGLIISFSSLIGLTCDLVFPQLIKGITVRKLVLFSLVSSSFFALTLFLTANLLNLNLIILPLILLAMAIWGIYYELLGFAQKQFVADSTPLRLHAATWGVLGVFKSLAYFLGPLLGTVFLGRGVRIPLMVALIFIFIAFLNLTLHGKRHHRPLEIDTTRVNPLTELAHWLILFSRLWPIIILSLMMGLIDAFYWTVGAVWTEELAKINVLGSLFLSLHILPSLFMGFLVSRWQISEGKKRLAIKYFLWSNVFLALLGFSTNVIWQLVIVLTSSLLLAVSYPLVEGVYSDFVARMGKEKNHLIGLSSSTWSLAYIAGPILSGAIATIVGHQHTFVVIGLIAVIIGFLLLLITPKKLRLPQAEIKAWSD